MTAAPEHDRSGVAAVLHYVSERTGLRFDPARAPELRRKIQSLAHSVRSRKSSAFLDAIARDDRLYDRLVAELTVGETYYYREPAQLEYIRDTIVPDLLRTRGSTGEIRAWSAGCATGEEAYTLAMVLREVAPAFEVLGTDLSVERIERARQARYSSWSLRGLPESVVRRNFRTPGKQYVPDPQLSRHVTFRPLNLVSGEYPSVASGIWNLDLVLCRNVLIYLEPDAVASVARRLVDSLSPDGWLLLSASDPPIADLVECETVVTPAGVAYRRPRAASAIAPGRRSDPSRTGRQPPAPSAPRISEPAPPPRAESRASRTELLTAPIPEATLAELRVRVRSLADRGELASAHQECIAALRRSPFDAEMTCLQAILLLDSGSDGVEAAATARRALYLDRTLILAHLTLAQALSRQSDRGGARLALRNAVQLLERLDPGEPVPGTGGELAARLLVAARFQLGLLEKVE